MTFGTGALYDFYTFPFYPTGERGRWLWFKAHIYLRLEDSCLTAAHTTYDWGVHEV